MEEKTEAQIKTAYKVARGIAWRLMQRTRADVFRPHMDIEDFVQDGVLAWLEGRDMYHAMIESYREASPVSRWNREVLGIKEPGFTSFEEFAHTPEDEPAWCEMSNKQLDAEKIIGRIQEIEDPNTQFAVLAHLYFGLSLRQIGEIIGKSHELVRTILAPEVKRLKEEFKC